MTAVHSVTHQGNNTLIHPSLFQANKHVGLTSLVPSLVLNVVSPPSRRQVAGTHAFTIVARILNDPEMEVKDANHLEAMLAHTLETRSELVRKYADQWTVDIANPKELENKIEELIWTNALIYGVGGWAKDCPFKADFFLYVKP
jgi:hypothetical protein